MSLRAQRSNLIYHPGCFVVTAFLLATTAQAAAEEWKQENGDHFIVFYQDDSARPKEVIRKAEFYYNRIAHDLGYARHSNFWQWDKRVKIYLHPSKEAFQKATGQPAWSHGMASYFDKTIHSSQTNEKFLDSVLPHETAHLIFRDFVGIYNQVPLWMDEGVAQWEESSKRSEALEAMPHLAAVGNTFALETFMRLDIRKESDPARVGLFYTQSISLVDFLITTYGPASFTEFCRQLRDGKPIDGALRAAYPNSLDSVEEMEERWLKYLKVKRAAAEAAAPPVNKVLKS